MHGRGLIATFLLRFQRLSFMINQNTGEKALILQASSPAVSDTLFDSSQAQRLQNQSVYAEGVCRLRLYRSFLSLCYRRSYFCAPKLPTDSSGTTSCVEPPRRVMMFNAAPNVFRPKRADGPRMTSIRSMSSRGRRSKLTSD